MACSRKSNPVNPVWPLASGERHTTGECDAMNKPPTQASFSPPWFLIAGLLGGVAFVAYIVWDSTVTSVSKNANVIALTEDNWQKEVLESKIPVFVDFTASWCGPCKRFAPTVDRLAERYKGKVKVAKFDVGDNTFHKGRKLQTLYSIDGVPHVMIFTGGDRKPMEFPGAGSEMEFVKVLDSVLAAR